MSTEAVPSEGDVSECRYCETWITLLDGRWTANDGNTACTDTRTSYVPHRPKEG